MMSSRLYYLSLLLLLCTFVRSSYASTNLAIRQLARESMESTPSFGAIIGPVIQAPLQLLQQLFLELSSYLAGHSLRELLDIQLLQRITDRLPERTMTYWRTLLAMESQCIDRTLCDLADLVSRRLPHWAQQIVLVYLNTFSTDNLHYKVLINGLTTGKCPQMYDECNPEQFLARIRTNVTDTLNSTMEPIAEALTNLVNVTSSTIHSLAVENGEGHQVDPLGIPNRISESSEEEEKNNEIENENNVEIEEELNRKPINEHINHFKFPRKRISTHGDLIY